MGVMGAFVFAAQMVNFTLPGMPGTSGHLGGGVLLAILLGPSAGIVTMSAILIVQCLLFQDGGLLALGCNIINLGVVPCLLGSVVYHLTLGSPTTVPAWRQYLAAWLACVVGVTAGASMVPIESAASGVLQVPFTQFLGVMAGVHLIIALCEGAVTFAVIAYLRKVRPELMGVEPTDGTTAPDHVGYGACRRVDIGYGAVAGGGGELVCLHVARRSGMELPRTPLRRGRESGYQSLPGCRRGRPMAGQMVAYDRLHGA